MLIYMCIYTCICIYFAHAKRLSKYRDVCECWLWVTSSLIITGLEFVKGLKVHGTIGLNECNNWIVGEMVKKTIKHIRCTFKGPLEWANSKNTLHSYSPN